jgi:hypothetical protein
MATQGCRWRSNPGLQLANAFGVLVRQRLRRIGSPTPSAYWFANAFGVLVRQRLRRIGSPTPSAYWFANAFGVLVHTIICGVRFTHSQLKAKRFHLTVPSKAGRRSRASGSRRCLRRCGVRGRRDRDARQRCRSRGPCRREFERRYR